MAAFLETGLLVARADKAGKCYPWRSWENTLTLKKSWDMFAVEKKQSSPGLVVAATSPAGTRVTHWGVGVQQTKESAGVRSWEAAGRTSPEDTPPNVASPSVPMDPASTPGSRGPSHHACTASSPGM